MKNSTFIADHITQKLNASFRVFQGEEWTTIVTPFLDQNRDNVQLYARETPEGWLITDSGFFLDEIEMRWGPIPEVMARALEIAESTGVSFHGRRFEVTSPSEHFFDALMDGVSTAFRIMAVEPPRYQTKTIPFAQDVQKAISASGLYWKSHVHFSGDSGYAHQFNFEVHSPIRGQSLLKLATNSGAKTNFESYMFALVDITKAKKGVPVSMVTQRDTLSEEQRKVVEQQHGSVLNLRNLVQFMETPYEQKLDWKDEPQLALI